MMGVHWGPLARLSGYAAAFGGLTLGIAMAWLFVASPEGKTIPAVMSGLSTSPAMFGHILHFVLAFFAVHVALAAAWYALSAPLLTRLVSPARRSDAALASFLPVLLATIVWNEQVYPASQFATGMAAHASGTVLSWVLLVYVGVAALVSTAVWIVVAWRRFVRDRRLVVVAALGVGATLLIAFPTDGHRSLRDDRMPDVILIGVDSLRPDHVGALTGMQPSLTPNLDEMLSHASVMTRAWTPIGQTFAAWMSILTGQYPATHRAYYNLIHRDTVIDEGSLAHRLGEAGYHRVYALDEVRFSNMDRTYGFDIEVIPAIGAADFFAGYLDLPLVNIVSGFSWGRHVFPFVHINRAAPVVYRPEVFDARLARAIQRAPQEKPMFLVAHFELPHWPYRWAHWERYEVEAGHGLADLSPDIYRRSVHRADAQVGALLSELGRAGRLDNAIVVLLSDHGEAFVASEPMWTATDHAALSTDPLRFSRAFHGSNVISVSQNHVVLAFVGFGPQANRVASERIDHVTVSLTDIRPTLEEWLGLDIGDRVEGRSLMRLVAGEEDTTLIGRAVGVESGFSLPSIAAGNPDAAEILVQGAQYYDLDRKGRLFLRDEWLEFLRTQKQRAVVLGDWMLAALPGDAEGRAHQFVLADFATESLWVSPDFPDDAPYRQLVSQLCRLFANDEKFSAAQCETGIGL